VGWLTSIRNIRWQFQVLYGHIGIGTHVYIGAGAAIFINTYSYYKRLKYWRNWDYTYTVGGMGYKVKPPMHTKEVLKITKDKATVEYYDKGKGSWTYKVYKKYSSGSGGYARMLQGACVSACVTCVSACVCVCLRACVLACVRACVRACAGVVAYCIECFPFILSSLSHTPPFPPSPPFLQNRQRRQSGWSRRLRPTAG
jgi:hypothetical protein